MDNKDYEKSSIIDEIIESLDVDEKKKMKVSKINKRNRNKVKNINNEIEEICKKNKSNEAYTEKISLYKVNKKDVKEEYDIIMNCDNSDYIIYQKRK